LKLLVKIYYEEKIKIGAKIRILTCVVHL